jgi:conjugative transfer signal peptidase TraF
MNMNIFYKEERKLMPALIRDQNKSSSTALRYHRIINRLTATVLLGFTCVFLCDWLGLRFNTTRSVDPGFYWVVDKQPEKGDFVSFCPTETAISQMAYLRGYIGFGNCPGHYQRLLKIVYGMAGDNIEFQEQGISVNGSVLPQSALLTQDGLGRSLIPFSSKPLVLKPDELWVMTNRSPLSFDSRYFGPIRLAQVSNVVRPLWTWQ